MLDGVEAVQRHRRTQLDAGDAAYLRRRLQSGSGAFGRAGRWRARGACWVGAGLRRGGSATGADRLGQRPAFRRSRGARRMTALRHINVELGARLRLQATASTPLPARSPARARRSETERDLSFKDLRTAAHVTLTSRRSSTPAVRAGREMRILRPSRDSGRRRLKPDSAAAETARRPAGAGSGVEAYDRGPLLEVRRCAGRLHRAACAL